MTAVRVYSEVPEIVDRITTNIAKLSTSERVDAALNFRPESDDICIASGFKSGTSWVQQILHGLRSRGDMDFEDIDDVIVNLEYSPYGPNISTPQPFQPQIYKTHFTYDLCPKGFGKYIVVTRDPKDAAVSGYWHTCEWFFKREEMSLNEFVDYFVASEIPKRCSHFDALQLKHQVSWYPHRKDPNVLWLHYEDLIQDLMQCIKLISDFVDIGVGDDALLELVEHQASFDFMKKHEAQFCEFPLKRLRNVAAGLDREAGMKSAAKVRIGKVGEWKHHLTSEMAEAIDARWRHLFAPLTDARSYQEMRLATLRELGRPFADRSSM